MTGRHEPDEPRGSRPDLWGAAGATPAAYPALGPAAGLAGMLLSPSPFGSRSAIRPRNLPPSPSRLNRGYNRAPRGALRALDVPALAALDGCLLARVGDLAGQPAIGEGVSGFARVVAGIQVHGDVLR